MREHDCITDGCHYEGSLFCIYCGLTEDDLEVDYTLGPCGCTDYHMADCPTRTGAYEYDLSDPYDIEYDRY